YGSPREADGPRADVGARRCAANAGFPGGPVGGGGVDRARREADADRGCDGVGSTPGVSGGRGRDIGGRIAGLTPPFLVLVAGVLAGITGGVRPRAVAIGIVLHGVYVVSVGG